MKVAVICSNYHDIAARTANGTAIFAYSLICGLAKRRKDVEAVVFASGSSDVPIAVESITPAAASADPKLAISGRHFLFEQALIAKAFSMQDQFDVLHVNIGDGDIALPFLPFVEKPVLITIHNLRDEDYVRRLFALYRDRPNLHFISASEAQRRIVPDLKYRTTIYHGVDGDEFAFDARGGDSLMWAGRAIPEKGMDVALSAAIATGRDLKLFGIPRVEYDAWLRTEVLDTMRGTVHPRIMLEMGKSRHELIPHFQMSKAFILPIRSEEVFGFVFIESMSCGTPVIAYAKGSVPEVIEDGVTGFIVNASDDDVRGDWTVTRTGVEGLKEAIDRLYAMPQDEYLAMRRACRERVLAKFSIDTMVDSYIRVYRELATS